MRSLALSLTAFLLVGCAGEQQVDPGSQQSTPSPTPTASESPSSPKRTAPPPMVTRKPRPADPRWVFFTTDKRRYSSPWFPGRHRMMIGFGCTNAPYYSPDPACSGGHGFHHGIDVAIPCGTPLRAGRPATVLPNDDLGAAYGASPVLLRVAGMDVLIGHTRRVSVRDGEALRPGQRFARVSDAGAPDGCHLHFEVRRPGGGVSDAVDPTALLSLH